MQFAVYLNGDVSGLILLEDTQLLGPCMLKWSIATLKCLSCNMEVPLLGSFSELLLAAKHKHLILKLH